MTSAQRPDRRHFPFAGRLRIPAIVAPMLGVSTPELVEAACRHGVVGAFPTANARSTEQLDAWLRRWSDKRRAALDSGSRDWAPWCPNLIIRQPRLAEDLEVLTRREVEMVITSVGSPAAVIPQLHDAGVQVWADVASLRHAERAIAAGVDGLVLLSAGAGGQTGWMNPFAFVREIRRHYDGTVVLAGGVSDGIALRAATTLGADLAYVGTRFIATSESGADPRYKAMLVDSTMDDIVLTRAFTGLPSSMLRASIEAAGLHPDRLDEAVDVETASALYGSGGEGPRRWSEIWSAGHSVSGVRGIQSVEQVVDEFAAAYESA
ncbi:nitronate monooxygenase [Microbacterium terrae]|uniref:Nitronate monooxygenase n=1 Tax=Microbacterium terrae TaxID=69369 RepID=A0A0M2H1S4_9MICO|nr:nitronate monooxygenase [Microbacterium terrae]KJL37518.1 Nitronate monooxygenase [Microbacterium terrae]MBP1076347.1 nitronate monooxygenase [Microbacterium terrae]GLJ97171.1 2-nitropropane dioxygenase [Microbacterium terrae]